MEVVVAAIKEETYPEIEQRGATAVHWLSLGELSRLIETFKGEGVSAPSWPDRSSTSRFSAASSRTGGWPSCCSRWRTRNTDSLIGAVAKVLGDEGITLMNSTALLEPLLAPEGVLTRRAPSDSEQTNITYGRAVAHHLARFDIGQTVVIAEAACVAVEAMEGTDATIVRAGEMMKSPSLGNEPSTLSRALTVVKVAKPNQDMRFDVPVVGLHTIETMKQAGATCLALDAGRCLLLDKEAMLAARQRSRYLRRRRNAGQPHSTPQRAVAYRSPPSTAYVDRHLRSNSRCVPSSDCAVAIAALVGTLDGQAL